MTPQRTFALRSKLLQELPSVLLCIRVRPAGIYIDAKTREQVEENKRTKSTALGAAARVNALLHGWSECFR